MKIAMLGGTFNPIHIGHLAIADDVCNSLGYDKILFVPTNIPPHKIVSNFDNAKFRAKMIELAIQGDSRFALEPCELEREGVSYSIDTATFLTKKYSAHIEGKLGLIIGQENAAEFDKWRDASKLAEITDIIIARRRDFLENSGVEKNLASLNAQNQQSLQDYKNVPLGTYTGGFEESDYEKVCASFKYNFLRLENIYLPISSTQIRKRIAKNQGFRYLVPNAVFEYILNNKLYE